MGEVDPFTKEGRTSLTKMIIRLFDLWDLSMADQTELLGLSSSRSIRRYRRGASFPTRRELIMKVGILIAIHKNLRVSFPRNREVVYRWPTIPNAAFGGGSPVDYVKEKGFDGLVGVHQYLQMNWNDEEELLSRMVMDHG
jgi:hypothetical protein